VSGTALLQVQQSVRDRLTQDPALGALVTAIYDHAPPSSGATFPYLVLGEKSEKDFDTFGRGGSIVSLVIDIRSQAAEDDELLDVYNRIREVLHEQPFALTGREVVDAQTTMVRTLVDPDGVTRRGEARFQVTVQDQP